MLLKSFLKNLLPNTDQAINIEHRLFEITLGLTVVVFLFWSIYGLFAGYGYFVQTVYISGVFIYTTLYVLQKKGIRFRTITLIYYYVILLLLGISWFPSGGIKAAIPTFLVLVYLSGLLVLSLKDYLIFIITIFGLVLGLILLEMQAPEKAALYQSNELLMKDLAIVILTSLIIMGICLYAFKRTYINDRRELRKRNKELAQEKRNAESTDQAKTIFLTTISHEMRTPLNGIVGMTELLSKTDINDEQHELIDSLVYSSSILHDLVSNVLDITTIEAGKLKLHKSSFTIKEELNGIWKIFQKKTSANKYLEIKLEVDENLPDFLTGDMARIRQVLVNLLSNAIKFTYKGTIKLKVEVLRQTGDVASVQFTIKDTGVGIALEKQPHLFETFYKASEAEGYEGTGLGLSIVEKLVTLMGGTISFESATQKGSSFYFTLPLGISDMEDTKELGHIEVLGLSELKVLIVEDIEINRLVVSKMLSRINIREIDIAVNGTEGVKKAKEKLHDIILMDLQMPDISGFEASKQITNHYEGVAKKPIIIALTANAMKSSMEKSMEVGMSDYLLKPIKTDTLKKVLMKYLNDFS